MGNKKDLWQGIAALIVPFSTIALLFLLFSSRIESFFIGNASESQLRSYHSAVYAGNETSDTLSYEVYEVSVADNSGDEVALGESTEPPHDKDCTCCC